jgi:SAM-dependent methyltransferase
MPMTMKKLIKAYFKGLYDSMTRKYIKTFSSLLEKNPKALLLDAGCADGTNTVAFGKVIGTTHLVGLELVESAAKAAAKKGIKVAIADLNNKLQLKDSIADCVVSNHVIEHLYNVDGFVSEIFRVLKPGGYLVIGTPNLASWHNIFALVAGRQPYSGPTVNVEKDLATELKSEKNQRLLKEAEGGEDALGHVVVMTYKTLVKLLLSKGFAIEKAYGFGYHPFPGAIAGALAKIDKSHSHYILIKARKPANK